MIHFTEGMEKQNIADMLSSPAFKDIKPDLKQTEDPHMFWDTMFAEPIDISAITEDELAAEIFGRTPDEFSFDFPFDDEVAKALTRFDSDEWAELTVKERLSAIESFVEILGVRMGLENKPTVTFFDGPENELGAYIQGKDRIEINWLLLDDPEALVNTVAHEMRHAYQHERAQSPETWMDVLYAVNFENYISPIQDKNGYYVNFEDYQDQLIEAEARAFAKMFTNKEAE